MANDGLGAPADVLTAAALWFAAAEPADGRIPEYVRELAEAASQTDAANSDEPIALLRREYGDYLRRAKRRNARAPGVAVMLVVLLIALLFSSVIVIDGLGLNSVMHVLATGTLLLTNGTVVAVVARHFTPGGGRAKADKSDLKDDPEV